MHKPNLMIAAAACAALLAAQSPTPEVRKKESSRRAMKIATGTFEVKMLPPPAEGDFTRLSIDKTFAGGLDGTSRVEMLASGGGATESGGYVALERFAGKLDGRSGGFVMQHSGIMGPGMMEIKVLVTPGSGTGELENISGTLEIRIEGKKHFYTLQYALPAKE